MTQRKTEDEGKDIRGKCALVNGLNMYYEIHGAGKPLILLHGGVGASEMFGHIIPELAESWHVIAVHLQAHGRTVDIDRPLGFESMADDMAALIKHLGIEEADIMGYSLGGGVALQTAIRHPDLIRKLVLISTPFKRNGWYPEVLEGMAQMTPEAAKSMEQSPLSKIYPDVNWKALFAKLRYLLGQDYDWSKEVASIKAPMMIIFADADAVRMSHITEFFDLLGGGQRDAGLDGSLRPKAWHAILPGMTHYDVLYSPGLGDLATRFLNEPMPNG